MYSIRQRLYFSSLYRDRAKYLAELDDIRNNIEVPLPPIPKYQRSRIKLYSTALQAFLKQILP